MTTDAPAGLGDQSLALWTSITTTYELEEWHRRLLVEALRALDRAEEARERLNREGLTVVTRFKEIRANPLVLIERDARAAFVRNGYDTLIWPHLGPK